VATCTNCGHSLLGLPGAPIGQSRTFTADVRCPECGTVLAAGTAVLIGGSTPFAMTRARRWYERAFVSLVYGAGIASLFLHILAGFSAWYLTVALMDLATGGRRFTGLPSIPLLMISSVVLIGTAHFWWRRRPSAKQAGKRADEVDKCVVIGPTGIREGKRSFTADQVRAIQAFECVGAGDGMVVVAVRVIAMTEFGTRTITDAVHLVIPKGTLPAFADSLMASLRGRTAPAGQIGDTIEGETVLLAHEIEGETILPRFNRRWIGPATILAVPVMIALAVILGDIFGGLVGVIVGFSWLILLPFAAEPSIMTPPVRWTLSPKTLSTALVMPIVLGATSRTARPATLFLQAWPTDEVRRIELRASHGMPYLVVCFKSPFRFSRRIVPDDWKGIAPEAYAQQVADRLGVPLLNRFPR
jgi:hypothetical protein